MKHLCEWNYINQVSSQLASFQDIAVEFDVAFIKKQSRSIIETSKTYILCLEGDVVLSFTSSQWRLSYFYLRFGDVIPSLLCSVVDVRVLRTCSVIYHRPIRRNLYIDVLIYAMLWLSKQFSFTLYHLAPHQLLTKPGTYIITYVYVPDQT